MATPYPNAHQIEEMYCNRASPATFKGYLDENIEGHIVGREFQIGGYFKSVDGFYEAVHAAIVPALKEETMRQEVRRVIGGADSPWAAVECIAFADSKYGMFTHSSCNNITLSLKLYRF